MTITDSTDLKPFAGEEQTVSFTLTDEERTTLRNLQAVLPDRGVQSKLAAAFMAEFDFTDPAARLIGLMIEDVLMTDVETMYEAAESLQGVTDFLDDLSDTLPPDFVPSAELVRKCIDAFYQHARLRATQAASS